MQRLPNFYPSRRSSNPITRNTNPPIDAYSAFASPIDLPALPDFAPLTDALRVCNIDVVYIVGLTVDYCVSASALDARKAGYTYA